MPGSTFTGPLKIKKSDGTKVTFVDANGNLVAGTTLAFDSGDTISDTNSNELIEFTVTASAVNHIGIVNSATGNNPIIRAEGEADTGITFDNSEGEEILILDSVATSVNEITIKSAATGNNPIIAATGEADTGITFENGESEEILILDAIATAVNEITIKNAATGNKPIIAATGEADNGIEFHNDQAEEILILASAATSVNEITITSAAAAANPTIAATGGDSDIDVELTPKGTGNVKATTGCFEHAVETVTTGSPTLTVYGATQIDSSGGAVTGTLGSGTFVGQIKTIVMTDASNSSTISITNHETSDPEVATFDAVDEYGLFIWTGTEWATVSATCTFV